MFSGMILNRLRRLASWFLEMGLPLLPYSAHGRPSAAIRASQISSDESRSVSFASKAILMSASKTLSSLSGSVPIRTSAAYLFSKLAVHFVVYWAVVIAHCFASFNEIFCQILNF